MNVAPEAAACKNEAHVFSLTAGMPPSTPKFMPILQVYYS